MVKGGKRMKVTILTCRECGEMYVFKKINPRDSHRCQCGTLLSAWSNGKGYFEVEESPNEPHKKEKQFSCGEVMKARQNKREPKYPTKGMTIELDCKPTDNFNETLDKLKEETRGGMYNPRQGYY